MIYFIRAASSAIKIGISKNPERRLATMQTGSPVKLTLLAVVPGTREDEQKLHARFEEQRLFGEWFEPTAELEELIKTLPVYRPRTRKVKDRPTVKVLPGLSWRIEFNRRKTRNGEVCHWVYRFGSSRNRTAVYGGMVQPWMQ